MFRTRLISGVVLVAATILAFLIGGNLLLLINLCLSVVCLYELFKAFGLETMLLSKICYGLVLLYYLIVFFVYYLDVDISLLATMFIELIILAIVYVIKYPQISINDFIKIYFSLIYSSVAFSFVYMTRSLLYGNWLVWLIILSSWGCDTCAYLAGMKFGKNKLSPELSPKKSQEGAVGGILGAMLLGFILSIFMMIRLDLGAVYIIKIVLICMFSSIVSQFGDLFASGIKREYNIKDYGNIIPGHGGILDRFDSVIFVAPIVYCLSIVLM